MASISRFFRNLLGLSRPVQSLASVPFSQASAQSQVFAEGDRVFLRARKEILSAPLQKNNRVNLPGTFLNHNDIIGQLPGATVRAQNGSGFRIAHPTLEQYVTYTPRKVTPIYAHDANLIVSLLDINVPSHATRDPSTPPLEILEAGTGHGSLTIHLARAIHAANPAPPTLPSSPTRRSQKNDTTVVPLPRELEWSTYSASRSAIIHTVDASPSFSVHAEKLIRGFRRGMYAPHVDFYVSHLSDWISTQLANRTITPFISYTLLDLPSVHTQLPLLVPILKQDGLVAVFVPSITQVGDCVRQIKKDGLPFVLERTLELGMGISGGRMWDVRLTSPRARRPTARQPVLERRTGAEVKEKDVTTRETAADENAVTDEESDAGTLVETEEPTDVKNDAESARATTPNAEDAQVLVCRPKVGERIVGGGFVALFRKTL